MDRILEKLIGLATSKPIQEYSPRGGHFESSAFVTSEQTSVDEFDAVIPLQTLVSATFPLMSYPKSRRTPTVDRSSA